MSAKSKPPKKKLPPASPLGAVLRRLRASARYEMLKDVKLATFLPPGRHHELAELSLRELSELRKKKIDSAPFDAAALEKLQAVLGNAGPVALSAVPKSARATTIVEQDGESGASPFASSQVEQQLIEAFSRLSAAPHFDREKSRTLGEFWRPEWPKAPFEQCLTFGQLAHLKPETFIKKRSLGPSKIAAVVGAIEAFVDRRPASLPRTRVEIAADDEPAPAPHIPSPAKVVWKERHSLPPAAAHLISYFELRLAARALPQPLAAVLQSAPSSFGAAEFALLWIASQSAELAAALFALPAREISQRTVASRKCLLAIIERDAPQLYYHWNSSLSGAGALKRELLAPYRVDPIDDDFEQAMWEIFIFAFGAVPPKAFGTEFPDFRAKRADALEVILNTALATLPRADADLRADLGVLLPHFPIAQILSALKQRAFLDPEDGMWKAAM
jgi:hypothetical protein